MKLFKPFLIGLIALSFGATIYIAVERIGWEGDYRTVVVAVSYRDLIERGAMDGTLEGLSHRGIGAIAIDPAELDQTQIEELGKFGLEPVFLFKDLYRYDAEDLKRYLAEASRLRPRLILFQDEGRPNYTPEQLREIARSLGDDRILVGILEFSSQPEVSFLSRRGFRGFVRAHTIKLEELEQLPMEAALTRFQRAARERNIRLLWVRLFDAPLPYNLDYLKRLTALLREDGFEMGIPEAAPDFKVPRGISALILLGPLALALLALGHTWQLGLPLNLLLLLVGIGLIFVGLSAAEGVFVLVAAWGTAVLVPLSAYLLLAPGLERGEGWRTGLLVLLAFSGMALLGGLWVGTVLSGTELFLKLEGFRGVKAALLLPLFGVILLHFARHGLSSLRGLLLRRPALGELLLLLFGTAVVLIVLLRSDNYSTVTGLEEWLREALENVLYARPRFKEFLLGHPLLLLWGASGRRLGDYAVVVLALGMIGQVSIINTFAHLHSPLLLSLLRTANGLLLGLPVGLILLMMARWSERLWRSGS